VDLLQHAERLRHPEGTIGLRRIGEVLATLARRCRDIMDRGGRIEIWLDGNVALEDLAAGQSFCDGLAGQARLLVHLPPHELGAAEGLDAAGVGPRAPRAWDDADGFLVVGSPFASHPPVAAHLMRWGAARRRTPSVVVDSVAGITAHYASHPLICRPGYEYWVIAELLTSAGVADATDWLPPADLCRQIVRDSGADMDDIHRAAQALRSTRHPAVVIAPSSGSRARWRALTALVSRWASRQDGMVTLLTGHANTLGAARFMRHRSIADWGTGLGDPGRAKPDLLLVIGWDPSSAYPPRCWMPDGKPAGEVVLASAFGPAQADWVDTLLPLAMASEVSGSYLLADGEITHASPILPALDGVPGVCGLLAALSKTSTSEYQAAAIDEGQTRSMFEEAGIAAASIRPKVTVPAAPAGNLPAGLSLVLAAEPMHCFDGQLTRHARWLETSDLKPEVRLSVGDADALGCRDGGLARLRNARGEVEARVVVDKRQVESGACYVTTSGQPVTAGWGGISAGHAGVRRLADWQPGLTDEAAQAGVIHVEVHPIEAPMTEELHHAHA
jgi:hypothetical protein